MTIRLEQSAIQCSGSRVYQLENFQSQRFVPVPYVFFLIAATI